MSRPSPPAAVVAAAAVSIPVGLLGLGLGLVGFNLHLALAERAEGSAAERELAREVGQAVPGWIALEEGKAALAAVLGAALVVGGAGLLLRRPWARRLCLGYAFATLLLHPAYLGLQLGYVRPAAQGLRERRQQGLTADALRNAWRGARPPRFEAADDTAALVGMVGAAGLFVGHALFLLVALRLGAGDRWAAGTRPRASEAP